MTVILYKSLLQKLDNIFRLLDELILEKKMNKFHWDSTVALVLIPGQE